MDNQLGQASELVWITVDVVYHRNALRTAVPGPATDQPGSRTVRAKRDIQLALDFADEPDEDAC
jgi:hypothetical protein